MMSIEVSGGRVFGAASGQKPWSRPAFLQLFFKKDSGYAEFDILDIMEKEGVYYVKVRERI